MSSFSPGASLGPYQVVAPLGAGGMGEVFKARDTRLDRIVALKILPQHLSSSEELRQRFEREARAISKLSHPHVCQLFDIGHESGISYLVMEYLEGETLAQRLANGPIPLTDTLKYAAQIAEALEAAHREGILHRDMKPGNVVLTKMGAKLLDFGLAKDATLTAGAGDISASPTLTSPLTTEGTIVGTYQYIAPEVLEGQTADKRADIFGFGAMLFEMITGQKAFYGKTQASVIAAVLEREPARASALTPTTPARLDELVRVCLLKDRDERRQSMHDIALELKSILAGLDDPSHGIAPVAGVTPPPGMAMPGGQVPHDTQVPGAPTPPGAQLPADSSAGFQQVDSSSGIHPQSGAGMSLAAKPRSSALPWTLALLAPIAVAVLMSWLNRKEPEPEQPRMLHVSIALPDDKQLELSGIHPGPPALSPDGTRIAFTAVDTSGNALLHVRRLDEPGLTILEGTENAGYPFWSPDGNQIGFFAAGKLRKIDATGGASLSICDASAGKGGSWHANGTILFAPSFGDVIHQVPSAGGDPTPVTRFGTGKAEGSHRFPAFLPDGKHFIYFARRDSGESVIRLADFAGVNRDLIDSQSGAVYADDHVFYMKEGTLLAHPFDATLKDFTGEAVPVAEEVEYLAGAVYGVFSVSNHGEFLYLPDTDASLLSLTWYDRDGVRLGPLAITDHYDDLSLSPDGKHVAVAVADPETGRADIWVVEIEREIQTRLTFDRGEERTPIWSPDGNEIAYGASEGDEFALYRKDVFGGAEKVEILRRKDWIAPLDWHSNGSIILCRIQDDLWVVPLDADSAAYVWDETEFVESLARFSPDGKWVAYSSDEAGVSHVYVTAFPDRGKKWQVSGEGGGAGPRWSASRQEIIFFNVEEEALARATYELKKEELIFERAEIVFETKRALSLDMTRDGNRFMTVEQLSEGRTVPLNLVVNWKQAFAPLPE